MDNAKLGYPGPTLLGGQASIKEASDHQSQNMAMRENLRGRIVSRALRVQNSIAEHNRLERLAELAEKHPDFIEMFDLIQSLDLM